MLDIASPVTGPAPARCVVTGAAGFIGSHLVDRLLALGHHVVGIESWDPWYPATVKRSNLRAASASDRFELVALDVAADELTGVLRDGDIVFHLAARAGVQDSWGDGFETTMNANVVGTQRLLETALAAGCERVVFASSSSVYGETAGASGARVVAPVSPYGVSKAAGEQLADVYGERGLDVVSLRYFTVYGARQRPDMAFHRLFRAATAGVPDRFPLRGSGEQRREFTHVSDVVQATIAAGFTPGVPGRRHDVGGGSSVRLLDVISTVERITGSAVRIDQVAPAAGDPAATVADCERTRVDLEWAPSIELIDGLVDQWRWHCDVDDRLSRLAG